MRMERIIEHIERLLLQHDCVIIPDFGGFVLQSVPAVYKDEEHAFLPAHKEIVFNPTLTHNDGLLMEAYMQSHNVDFAKAQQFVRNDVVGMKEVLDNDAELSFGAVGLFMKEGERLLFISGKNSKKQFSTQTYGLPVFHYLPLSVRRPKTTPVSEQLAVTTTESEDIQSINEDISDQTKKQSDNVIYHIPVTRTFLQVVGIAAAAILLFFLISTPVGDVSNASYSASFVPQEIMPKKTAEEIVLDAFSAVNGSYSSTSSSSSTSTSTGEADNAGYLPEAPSITSTTHAAETSRTAAEVPETPKPMPASATATASSAKTTVEPTDAAKVTASNTSTKSVDVSSTAASTESASTKASSASTKASSTNGTSAKATSASTKASSTSGGANYYVIIGSWKTKAQAQTQIKQLKGTQEAGTAQMLVKDGRVRVYVKSFTSEKSANSYVKQLRQHSRHKQAWVYKGS